MRYLSIILCLILTSACAKQTPPALSASTKKSGAIIGGEAVGPNDFALTGTVALYVSGRRGLEMLCTGTLISRNLVVSAAHCLQSIHSQIYISFGVALPKSVSDPLMVKVTDTVSHPDFKVAQKAGVDGELYWTTEKDIALLKIGDAVPEGYAPVAIHADTDKIPLFSSLLLAGFGNTSDEEESAAKSMNQVEVFLDSVFEEYLVIDQSDKKGACFGDSGGPAYLQTDDGGWLVVGATHAARPGYYDCHHLSDYTSLSKYTSFIKSVATQLQAEQPQFVLPQSSAYTPFVPVFTEK